MRLYGALIMAVAAAVLVAADEPKGDAAKKEMDKFQGTWTLESLEANGQPVPEEQIKGIKLVVEGNKRTLKKGDEVVGESTYKLDPTKKPKQIEITQTKGQLEGRTVKGIYEIDGDTQKVCLALEGDPPTEFAGKEGVLYQVFKRQKK